MAMTIMNNTSAMLTLGQLNKNISKVGKELKKASSGMKLNSAGDDASAYSISEKMRVRIRGLNQDEQNVKNGKSLLKVGAGGIDNIVDELRNLKELALNAANDHNTDLDRATLQKEFDQRTANINDIAATTNYNGKTLLDGSYRRYRKAAYQPADPTSITTSPVTVIPSGDYTVATEGVFELPPGYTGTITIASGLKNVKLRQQNSAPLSGVYIKGPASGNANLWIENLNISNSRDESIIEFSGSDNYLSISGSNTLSHNGSINYDKVMINMGDGLTLCGRGVLNINDTSPQSAGGIGVNERQSTTGSIIISSGTYNINISQAGAGIGTGWGGTINNIVVAGGNLNINSASGAAIGSGDGGATVNNIVIGNDAKINANAKNGAGIGSGSTANAGDILISKRASVTASSITGESIGKGRNGTVGNVTYTDNLGLDDLERYIKTEIIDGIPLTIHHGTKANQAVKVYINDMHTESMGLTDVSVVTRDKAVNAISLIDNAIDYALDEATYIGAYISRLEYTEANLVTANESTQASESTIRDADMAKAMTEYTKSNVLAQASQSMLAQANQTSASALSLLQ